MSIKYQVTYGVDERTPETKTFDTYEQAVAFADGIDIAGMWETEYQVSHYTNTSRNKVFYKGICAIDWDDEWDEAGDLIDETDYYEEYGYEQHVAAEEA